MSNTKELREELERLNDAALSQPDCDPAIWLRNNASAILDKLKQAEQAEELQATFDLQWKADMRAVERWRKEKPSERELQMPDRADMCFWLIGQVAELERTVDALRSQVKVAEEALELIADQTYVDFALHHDLITRAAKEALAKLREKGER